MKNFILKLLPQIGTGTDDVRANWVIQELKKLPKGLKILDAGAGELRFKKYCTHLEYFSQDFGKYDGSGDGIGLQTGSWDNSGLDIVSDITNIPVGDNSFDVILCSEVFEHIPDAVLTLKEFDRILKPGGILLITAPFNSLTHFAPYHFSGYNNYWYKHHLSNLNYTIELLDHNGSWFSFVAQELRRSKSVYKLYSVGIFGYIFQVFTIPLLFLLALGSKFDKQSHELLCFAFMVRAKKNV